MKTQVSLASPEDAAQASEWLLNTPDNLLDPAVISYPNLRTLKVDVDGEPVLYVPFHPVFCLESLGVKPGVSPRKLAYALRKAQDALEELAKAYGIKEVIQACKEPTTLAFSLRHGYEKLPGEVLRKKVS